MRIVLNNGLEFYAQVFKSKEDEFMFVFPLVYHYYQTEEGLNSGLNIMRRDDEEIRYFALNVSEVESIEAATSNYTINQYFDIMSFLLFRDKNVTECQTHYTH